MNYQLAPPVMTSEINRQLSAISRRSKGVIFIRFLLRSFLSNQIEPIHYCVAWLLPDISSGTSSENSLVVTSVESRLPMI